jgi:site-specific DNA-methyltransferase (adenine-specific)
MNPPYGRSIKLWLAKASREAAAGATVVCLLPARTDTTWWHEYCSAAEVRFLRGRIRFGGCKSGAPFPSAVVVMRPFSVACTTPVAVSEGSGA